MMPTPKIKTIAITVMTTAVFDLFLGTAVLEALLGPVANFSFSMGLTSGDSEPDAFCGPDIGELAFAIA
jgi:hypothetical protein